MFNQPQRNLLARLYDSQPIPLDRLPYTPEFESLCEQFNVQWQVGKTRNEIWCALMDMRKDGDLPSKTNRKKSRRSGGEQRTFL